MGRTLRTLASVKVPEHTIFNNRFVIEVCERFHIHYRNLRLSLSKEDFIEICKGCIQAFERWNARGCPENPKVHIELCRKHVAKDALNEGIKVNLNKNLYVDYEGKIFSEGAKFSEEKYIHLKMRDTRIEMSIAEFMEVADVIAEAKKNLVESAVPVQEVLQGSEGAGKV